MKTDQEIIGTLAEKLNTRASGRLNFGPALCEGRRGTFYADRC